MTESMSFTHVVLLGSLVSVAADGLHEIDGAPI